MEQELQDCPLILTVCTHSLFFISFFWLQNFKQTLNLVTDDEKCVSYLPAAPSSYLLLLCLSFLWNQIQKWHNHKTSWIIEKLQPHTAWGCRHQTPTKSNNQKSIRDGCSTTDIIDCHRMLLYIPALMLKSYKWTGMGWDWMDLWTLVC